MLVAVVVRVLIPSLLCVASLLPELAPSARGQGLEGRFTLDKQSFLAGEPVFVNLEIVNRSDRSLIFLLDRCSCNYSFVLVQPKVESTGCGGMGCGGSCGNRPERLEPGQKFVERRLLNEWLDITQPRRYRVTARDGIRNGSTEAEAWSSVPALAEDDLDFEIVPADDSEGLRKAYQPVLADLNSKDHTKRLAAARVIGHMAPPALEPEILALAADNDKETQYSVLDALRKLGTPATKAALFGLAGHGPLWTQSAAILNLGKTGDESYLPFLLACAKSEDPDPSGLQRSCLSAAAELGHAKALPLLLALIESPRIEERKNALWALPDAPGREAIPVLIRLLLDPNKEIRTNAEHDLERLTHRVRHQGGDSEAHARWLAWWNREGGKADLHGPEVCIVLASLD